MCARHRWQPSRAPPLGSDIAQAPARGADLGLSIVRSAARAHGGHAQAQALAAGGLEFTINGARIWCGQGVFAHSLVKPGGLLKAKHSKAA